MNRRDFLAVAAALPFARGLLFAQDQKIESQGEVLVNGKSYQKGAKIAFGDEIETKGGAKVQFNINKDAFKIRENSKVAFAKSGTEKTIKLISGGILAVFEKEPAKLETKTATIGIRGTGLYAEQLSDKLYVCNCYGVVDFKGEGLDKTVQSEHHDEPLYFFEKDGKIITKDADVLNHTDEELLELEEMVDRTPPFYPDILLNPQNYKQY